MSFTHFGVSSSNVDNKDIVQCNHSHRQECNEAPNMVDRQQQVSLWLRPSCSHHPAVFATDLGSSGCGRVQLHNSMLEYGHNIWHEWERYHLS